MLVTRFKQQLGKKLKITFASLSKNGDENEKETKEKEKEGNCKTFCVTLKRNNKSFSPKPLAIPKFFCKHAVFQKLETI